jgi:DNA repair exonuclease SbcCD ATPase subunit
MDRWNALKGKIEMLEHNKNVLKNKIFELKNNEKKLSESIAFLYNFSEYTRTGVKNKIEKIANIALKTVFTDKSMQFLVIPDKNKKGLYYDLYINTNGTLTELEDAKGGGVLDVISLALRISYLKIFQGQLEQLLILDEPFKNLDKQRLPKAIEWMKKISEEMKIQFIIVTHIEELIDLADNSYYLQIRNKDVTHVSKAN